MRNGDGPDGRSRRNTQFRQRRARVGSCSTAWRSVDGNAYDNVVGGVSGRYIDRSPPVMEVREGSLMPSCLCSMSQVCRSLAEV